MFDYGNSKPSCTFREIVDLIDNYLIIRNIKKEDYKYLCFSSYFIRDVTRMGISIYDIEDGISHIGNIVFYDNISEKRYDGYAKNNKAVEELFYRLGQHYKIQEDYKVYYSIFKRELCVYCGNAIQGEKCLYCNRMKDLIHHPGYVYFILDGFCGQYIKIGYSSNMNSRVTVMKTWQAGKAKILFTIPGGIELEQKFHQRFSEYNYGLEWFKYTGQFKEWVDSFLWEEEDA